MPETSYAPDPRGSFTPSREFECDCPGGSGSGSNFSGAGSPEGSVTGSTGDTYLDTSNMSFWAKGSGTGTNTGWVQLIA